MRAKYVLVSLLIFSAVAATSAAPAKKKAATKPTDAELIASAKKAAPPSVAKGATIVTMDPRRTVVVADVLVDGDGRIAALIPPGDRPSVSGGCPQAPRVGVLDPWSCFQSRCWPAVEQLVLQLRWGNLETAAEQLA